MKYPHIVAAKAIDNQTLLVKFTDDEFRQYNISKFLENPMFAKLHNPAFFKNFKIEEGGYGLVWDDDVDISEYELWQNGISVADEDIAIHLEHTHL
ncbi:DUF2442 domain-containing protein [Ancylothrix sp. C2]|uniref:DUF2442 domain-containing protein n=1 Tax=Ancylothrix sp. D3o TaxID=2953691 RepID=UPI0021BB4220|nr:DUF2442 domain-containing protein [Ancylothrix sp. D3o]MCT7953094.1 DUF2442 domain-containing protein [Ancylothrix sp. D3o]